MRWDNLTLSARSDQGALFGAEEVVERTFDTPEFRGMTFYEVRARSVVNKVPGASRMPFRWTINPYRGCSHACTYCLSGDTPILMADGRTERLADVRTGDLIYGTVGEGACRRLVPTEVLAQWPTVKPAYRVTLEDGTELVASGDHRLLTERGWKYVSGRGNGPGRRPHLSAGSEVVGIGGFAAPPDKTPGYRSGYLCGMVRGDGHSSSYPQRRSDDDNCSDDGLRLAPTDPDALQRAHRHLAELGVSAREVRRPAITRELPVTGVAIGNEARLRVVSVVPLGMDLPMYDITTGTGDFIANGVVSHNCFARRTHEYLDLDIGHDFDSKIVVKVNAPELLRAELRRPRWGREHIAMGTNVDPYQRAEGRYRLMPPILEALRDAANPFSILTKGTLVLRDLELLREAAAVTDVAVNVSVGFVDRPLWRSVEPGTPAPRARLDVCRALADAGIGCGVLMAPILPYLTDSDEQLDATVSAIAGAGATSVSPIVLHLRPGAREWYLAWLQREHPELVPRYRELYRRGAYVPKSYQDEVAARVARLARHHGVGRVRPGRARRRPA